MNKAATALGGIMRRDIYHDCFQARAIAYPHRLS